MHNILGLITISLGIIGNIPYIRDIWKGKTKPHLFSNLIWGITTGIVFLGQLVSGAGPGAWTTGLATIFTLYILFLSFKYGTKDITKSDKVFLVIGICSIIPWLLTKDPLVSVVLATAIDVCGFFPTIRKTIKDPKSETLSSWIINLSRHGLSLFAIINFSLVNYIFPMSLFVMNIILVSTIVIGRRKQKQSL